MKALEIVSIIVAVFMFICVSTLVYWLVYPYTPMTIYNVDTHTKEVEAGGIFEYSVKYCKYMNKPALLDKKFVDGLIFHVPQKILNQPTGCGVDDIAMEVPEFFDGEYHLDVIVTYQVNPIRTESVSFRTDDFLVVPVDN